VHPLCYNFVPQATDLLVRNLELDRTLSLNTGFRYLHLIVGLGLASLGRRVRSHITVGGFVGFTRSSYRKILLALRSQTVSGLTSSKLTVSTVITEVLLRQLDPSLKIGLLYSR